MTIFLKKVILKRPRIYPYPYWYSPVFGRMYYLRYPVTGAYIAGIQPQAINIVFNCHEGQPVVKVYVSNKRDLNSLLNISDSGSRIFVRHSNTNDFPPFILKSFYLGNCSADIPCISVVHRLDNNRSAAADQNIANLYLSCHPASHVTVHPKIHFCHPQMSLLGIWFKTRFPITTFG